MVIYLLTALFLGGFGNYLIPLMCGARDMVFPYMNMVSFWVYLLAVIVLLASFFVPGGPTGAGWTLYPPQAVLPGTPGSGWGIILMLVSLGIFIVAFTMGGLNYVTTVLQARCPRHDADAHAALGLGHLHGHDPRPARVPGAVRLRDHDDARRHARHQLLHAGDQFDGREPGHRTAAARCCSSICSGSSGTRRCTSSPCPLSASSPTCCSTHARKNIFGYRMMVWAILAIGGLSFVVWAHHMYVSGMNPYFGFFFATTTLIIAVPTAIKVYNWVLTLWHGDIHLTVPMLFAIGFIFTFVHGGLTGLFLGNVTVDLPLSDTYFVVGHFHMVMGVSPILVVFGAIYHWYPKITGRMYDDRLGKVHFWLTFLGTYAIYLPMHYLGILGVPRRYYALGETDFIPESVHTINEAITIAALVVARLAADLPLQHDLSLRKGKQAARIPGARRRSSGRRRIRRRSTATGAPQLPVVYRWAYDYSVPGAPDDFIPQNEPVDAQHATGTGHGEDKALLEQLAIVIALLVGIAVWWLVASQLTAKPWDGREQAGDFGAIRSRRRRASACGCSSRSSRRCSACSFPLTRCACTHGVGWKPPDDAGLLWLNTLLLVAGEQSPCSWPRPASQRGDRRFAPVSLIVAGMLVVRLPRRPGRSPGRRSTRRGTTWPGQPRDRVLLPADRVHGLHVLGGLAYSADAAAALRRRRGARRPAPERAALHDLLAFPAARLARSCSRCCLST